MPIFRVFGDKLIHYYTDVTANEESEAFDLAEDLESHEWFVLEDDDTIEAYNAELIEDKFIQDNLDIITE